MIFIKTSNFHLLTYISIRSEQQKFYNKEMRIEKENQFASFTRMLTKIDATNIGEYQLKVLKQEHDYLDRLRQQRIKIEELKKKYDDCEFQLHESKETNSKLLSLLDEKTNMIQNLQDQLQQQFIKRQNIEKSVQKQIDSDKNKIKSKLKDLQNQNEDLKKLIRQKQLMLLSTQEELSERLKRAKESFHIEKRNYCIEMEQRMQDLKMKSNDTEVIELRNLVSRQNKALRIQCEKIQQLEKSNQKLQLELEENWELNRQKQQQLSQKQEMINQMRDQLQFLSQKIEKQDSSNRLKNQLQEIRRKMAEMQKGQIERIELIVNQVE